MKFKKIKRAIISVTNKEGLNIILPVLKKFNVKIISSGGTYKKIKKMNYNCQEISSYTGFSEMLDGRVKTLHPKIHAGILNVRKNSAHRKEMIKKNIPEIDLVIIDLYPFEKYLEKKTKKIIEYVDIGGPAMIRAAAKNFEDVTIISNINDYSKLLNELKRNKGSTSLKFRKYMSAKAFSLTAYYDSIISNWFNEKLNVKFPERLTLHGKLVTKLRYGENPHQQSSLYLSNQDSFIKKIYGKELSYNNYNDIYSAISIINTFKKNKGVVIIKHANPCGASIEKNQIDCFKKALSCDPISSFGGVVAVNSIITKKLALEINKIFFEVIICRGFKKDALKILKRRKNIRLIDYNKTNNKIKKNYLFLENSFLSQDNNDILFKNKLKIVTRKKPSKKQIDSLIFAFNICKFVKSNAIVLVNGKSTIGIGAGQPSRVDSCKISSNKAQEFLPEKLADSVAASDAFFPFSDGIEELIETGVKAIIQPGGSINDKKIIQTANNAGIAMVFAGTRHFKH